MILSINELLLFLIKYDRKEFEEIEFPQDVKETLDYLGFKFTKNKYGNIKLYYNVSCVLHNLRCTVNVLYNISNRFSFKGKTKMIKSIIDHDKVFFCDYISGSVTQNGEDEHFNLECLLTNNLTKFLKTH